MKDFTTLGIRHQNHTLQILDQTRLPHEEIWLDYNKPSDMIEFIQSLRVRGAPLIGVAAALALAKSNEKKLSNNEYISHALALREARPTAVNLMHAIDLMLLDQSSSLEIATKILDNDIDLCLKMAKNGLEFINDGDQILTHCNTGGLATAGIGTALGIIKYAFEKGKKIHVYVDETRPLGQGVRLTTWELEKAKIPYTLICDNMAAFLMQKKKITKAFVGSDRIAVNGDFANKIGTYSVAALCKFHTIPFHCVAPRTTFDPNCKNGNEIPIEERNASEVRGLLAPKTSPVFNPAFDVTPHELIHRIILDDQVWDPN